ncbi:MAG: hypothetical protein KIS61_16675 [Candidatus Eremiobacteraeota bacterium]|nr:hypothetical protein [Candidatus Eremiobacteraeota bacterium]
MSEKFYLFGPLSNQQVELALRLPTTGSRQQIAMAVRDDLVVLKALLSSTGFEVATIEVEADYTYRLYYSPRLQVDVADLPPSEDQVIVLDPEFDVDAAGSQIELHAFLWVSSFHLTRVDGCGKLEYDWSPRPPQNLAQGHEVAFTGIVLHSEASDTYKLTARSTTNEVAAQDVEVASALKLDRYAAQLWTTGITLNWPKHPLAGLSKPELALRFEASGTVAFAGKLNLSAGAIFQDTDSYLYIPTYGYGALDSNTVPPVSSPIKGEVENLVFDEAGGAWSFVPIGKNLSMDRTDLGFDYQISNLSTKRLRVALQNAQEFQLRLGEVKDGAIASFQISNATLIDARSLAVEPELKLKFTKQYLHMTGMSLAFVAGEGTFSFTTGKLDFSGNADVYVPALEVVSPEDSMKSRFRFRLKKRTTFDQSLLLLENGGVTLKSDVMPEPVELDPVWNVFPVFETNVDGICFESGQLTKGEFVVNAPLPGLQGASTQMLLKLELHDGQIALSGVNMSVDLQALRVPVLRSQALWLELDRLGLILNWSGTGWKPEVFVEAGIYLSSTALSSDLSGLCRPGVLKVIGLDLLKLGKLEEVEALLPEPVSYDAFGGLLGFRAAGWLKLSLAEGVIGISQIELTLKSGSFVLQGSVGSVYERTNGVKLDLNKFKIDFPSTVQVYFRVGNQVEGTGQFTYSADEIGVAGSVRTQGFQFGALALVGRTQKGSSWVPNVAIYGRAPTSMQFSAFAIRDVGGGISVNRQLRGLGQNPNAVQILGKINELEPDQLENWVKVDQGDFFLSIVLTATLAPSLAAGQITQPWVAKLIFSLDTELRAVGAAKVWFFSSPNSVTVPSAKAHPCAVAAVSLQLAQGRFSLAAETRSDGAMQVDNFLTKLLRNFSIKMRFAVSKDFMDYYLEELAYRGNFLGFQIAYKESYRVAMVDRTLLLKSARSLSGHLGSKSVSGSCGLVSGAATIALSMDASLVLLGLIDQNGIQALADINLGLTATGSASIGVEFRVKTPWKTYKYQNFWGFNLGSFAVRLQGTLALDSGGEFGLRGRVEFPLRLAGSRYKTDVNVRYEVNGSLLAAIEARVAALEDKLDKLSGAKLTKADFVPAQIPLISFMPLGEAASLQVSDEQWLVFTPDKNPGYHVIFPAPTNPWLEDLEELLYSTANNDDLRNFKPVPLIDSTDPSPDRLLHAFALETCGISAEGNIFRPLSDFEIVTDPRYFGDSSPYWPADNLAGTPLWAPPFRLSTPQSGVDEASKEGHAFRYYSLLDTHTVVSQAFHETGPGGTRAVSLRGAFLDQLFQYAVNLPPGQAPNRNAPLVVKSTDPPKKLMVKRTKGTALVTPATHISRGKGEATFYTPCQDYFEDSSGERIELRFPVDLVEATRAGDFPTFQITRVLDKQRKLVAESVAADTTELEDVRRNRLVLLLAPVLPVTDVVFIDAAMKERFDSGRAVEVTYEFKWGKDLKQSASVTTSLFRPRSTFIPHDLALVIQNPTNSDDVSFGQNNVYRPGPNSPERIELPELDFFVTIESTVWTGYFGDEHLNPNSELARTNLLEPTLAVQLKKERDGSFSLPMSPNQQLRLYCRKKEASPFAPLIPLRPVMLYTDKVLTQATRFFSTETMERFVSPPSTLEVSFHELLEGGTYEVEWINHQLPHAGAELIIQDELEASVQYRQRCTILDREIFLEATSSLAFSSAWSSKYGGARPPLQFPDPTTPPMQLYGWKDRKATDSLRWKIQTDAGVKKFMLGAVGVLGELRKFLLLEEVIHSGHFRRLVELVDSLQLRCEAWLLRLDTSLEVVKLRAAFQTLEFKLLQVESDQVNPSGDLEILRQRAAAGKVLRRRQSLSRSLRRARIAIILAETGDSVPLTWNANSFEFEEYRDPRSGQPIDDDLAELKKLILAPDSTWEDSLHLTNGLSAVARQLSDVGQIVSATPIPWDPTKKDLEVFIPEGLRLREDSDPADHDWTLPTLRLLERLGLSAAFTGRNAQGALAAEQLDALLPEDTPVITIRSRPPGSLQSGHGYLQVIVIDQTVLTCDRAARETWFKARSIDIALASGKKWDAIAATIARIFSNHLTLESRDSEILVMNEGGRSRVQLSIPSPYEHDFKAAVVPISRDEKLRQFCGEATNSVPDTWVRLQRFPNRQLAAEDVQAPPIREPVGRSFLARTPESTLESLIYFRYALQNQALRASLNAISQTRTGWAGVDLALQPTPWFIKSPLVVTTEEPLGHGSGLEAKNPATSQAPDDARMFWGERVVATRELDCAFQYNLALYPLRRHQNEVGAVCESEYVAPICAILPGWEPVADSKRANELELWLRLPTLGELDGGSRDGPPEAEEERSKIDAAIGFKVRFFNTTDQLAVQVCDVLLAYHPAYPKPPDDNWAPVVQNLGPWIDSTSARAVLQAKDSITWCVVTLQLVQPKPGYLTPEGPYHVLVSRPQFPWTRLEVPKCTSRYVLT